MSAARLIRRAPSIFTLSISPRASSSHTLDSPRPSSGAASRTRYSGRTSGVAVICLALGLDGTMRQLLEPQPDAKQIELPNGDSFSVRTVRRLVAEVNDHAIYWKDDVPVLREVVAGWAGDPDMPGELKDALAA